MRTSSRAISWPSTISTRSSPCTRSSQTDAEASSHQFIERFGFQPEQTTAILEMKLRRLTGLERDKIEEELEGLRRAIAYYEDLLAHEEESSA